MTILVGKLEVDRLLHIRETHRGRASFRPGIGLLAGVGYRVTGASSQLRGIVARYLLVAHQTAERKELLAAAKQLASEDSEATFTLLVPATPVGDLLIWEEGETKDVAHARARSASSVLQGHGINVEESKVGDADPVLAVDDEFLAGGRYDAIVVATLPPGISRWIKMDVVSRLQRKRPQLRVIHVVAEEAPADAKAPGRKHT